jgi:DNA-binding CsgD family transcriptional regulator
MDQQRIARLTDQQRTCLRYVYRHMTSKEIAPLLGIEPNSVDQHLKAAMRVLGVGDRRTAARLLAEHEQRPASRPSVYQPPHVSEQVPPTAYQPLVYQPPDIEAAHDPVTMGSPIGSGPQFESGRAGGALREEQASFTAFSPTGAPTLPLPVGTVGSKDLNWQARLAWIAAIAIGVALAFGSLVTAVDALGRLLKG